MNPLVIIYTDGGCSPNPGLGGWGAVLISPAHQTRKELYGSEPDTTNNRMELLAAIMALCELKKPCQVELYTDSQYLKKAFTDGWLNKWQRNGWQTSNKKPVVNQDLWEELLRLTAVHTVAWKWVKGHASTVENNRCDQLVQRARDEYREARLRARIDKG